MSDHEHAEFIPIGFSVLITSDSRSPKTDLTGKIITKLLTDNGHKCISFGIVPNKKNLIRLAIKKLTLKKNIRLIVTSGGTGCGRKDVTIETVRPFISKELDGFGELFRVLSYKEIGSRALMSRALMGVAGGDKIIVCLPGSPNAAKLALRKLILPELNHLVWELSRA
ncbi:MAG: MogA/MoaB family molybdenum cofactor biosynthesis protein [Candidatus Brocadiia bacterium]